MKPVPHASINGHFGGSAHAASSAAARSTLIAGNFASLPVYRVEDQKAGARALGPAVLEEAFFTCRVDAGWGFEINDAGDILLSKNGRTV